MKKIKYNMVFVAFFVFLLGSFGLNVQAETKVNKDTTCSITFKIPKAYQSQLQKEEIPVRLYRIADITEQGFYNDVQGYESLKLSEMCGDVTAQQLEEKAAEASKLLKADVWKEQPEVTPEYELLIVNNQVSAEELAQGLYLVCVKATQKGQESYQALPYIISLPCLIELENSAGEAVQEWKYDLEVDLKLGSYQQENPGKPEGGSDNEKEPDKIVEPEKTEEPEKPEKPEEPEKPEKPDESEKKEETEKPKKEPDNVEEPEKTKVKYKTGDETNLALLGGGVVVFGVAFVIMLFWERISRRRKDGK